jgi:hypothetical protein
MARSSANRVGWWVGAFIIIVVIMAAAAVIGMTAGTVFSRPVQLEDGIAMEQR